jgi:hypothetical protein
MRRLIDRAHAAQAQKGPGTARPGGGTGGPHDNPKNILMLTPGFLFLSI